MDILYSAREYVDKLIYIMNNYSSYYAWGSFGAPANAKNRTRYNVPNANPKDFLWDCSGFAYKSLPWGWNGDRNKVYGGAIYKKIPELETNNILAICYNVSSDFKDILIGEVLYMKGHVGIYIGDGRAIECTSKWTNAILISDVDNISKGTNSYHRTWLKHGRLPFIDYSAEAKMSAHTSSNDTASVIKYTVKRGDTLWNIAKVLLGSGARYKEIMALNNLKSQTIYINQVLKILKKGK